MFTPKTKTFEKITDNLQKTITDLLALSKDLTDKATANEVIAWDAEALASDQRVEASRAATAAKNLQDLLA